MARQTVIATRGFLTPREVVDLASPGPNPDADIVQLRAAREQFLSQRLAPAFLRPVIQRSWPRSSQFGVEPDARRLDHLVEPRLEGRVQRAAEPVLQELGNLVQATRAAVILADPEGIVVDVRGEPEVRRLLQLVYPVPGAVLSEDVAGTNAIGTAIEEGIGVQVWSGEHFIEAFQGFFCTAIPIRDPLSRKILAVLDLTIRDREVSPRVARSLAQIVADAGAAVERALSEQLAAREQALLYYYLQELRRRAPVIAFDGRTTIASSSALGLLDQADLAALLAYAEEAIRGQRPLERQVTLGSGRIVQVLAAPKFDGGECVGTILRLKALAEEPARPSAPPTPDPFQRLVGQSQAYRQAIDLARTAAARGLPAYVYGESGAGKYALARAIAASVGGACATIECDCAGVSTSRWAAEAESTLSRSAVVIFRHVDTLRPAALRALARLLENATANGTPQVVLTGQRPAPRSGPLLELLQRLAAIQIRIPPLRERREDIPTLVQRLLERQGSERPARISPAALQALAQADWPANVRQLEQVVRSALLTAHGGEITPRDLPDQLVAASRRPRLSRLEEVELEELRKALREAGGNRARAAAALGIGRSTLYRKLDVYRLKGFNPMA